MMAKREKVMILFSLQFSFFNYFSEKLYPHSNDTTYFYRTRDSTPLVTFKNRKIVYSLAI